MGASQEAIIHTTSNSPAKSFCSRRQGQQFADLPSIPALLNSSSFAPTNLDAESAHGERTLVTTDEPLIEPRRAVAFQLLLKIVAREKA